MSPAKGRFLCLSNHQLPNIYQTKTLILSIDGSNGLVISLRINHNCTEIISTLHLTFRGVT